MNHENLKPGDEVKVGPDVHGVVVLITNGANLGVIGGFGYTEVTRMTDLDRFKALFESIGLEVKVEECKNVITTKLNARGGSVPDAVASQVISFNTGSEKVIGYIGFVAEFYFDVGGRFLAIGVYE